MRRLRPALTLASALLLVAGLFPLPANGATVWRFNLYRGGSFVFQDPYYTACTAAAVMTMLNITDLADTGGTGFRWTTYRTKNSSNRADVRDMTSILSFERSHDTLAVGRPGSDAHGWRNALKGAVTAIARFHKPVGLLAWAGGHAQVVTGYIVTGEDPSISDNFVVNGLLVSDVLASSRLVNRYINRLTLKSGDVRYRFQSYREVDSPLDDPYSVGWRRSSVRSATSEWYRRWVLVIPVRDGAPVPEPTPTPEPTPEPTPPPDPTPTPEPTPTPTEEASPPPEAPTATPTPTEPEATPSEAPAG